MKHTITLLLLFVTTTVLAQKYGTTDDGLRVQLNDNGTWVLLEQDSIKTIPLNKAIFTSSSKNIAVRKSTVNDIVLNYNPVKWKFESKRDNEASEFEFDHVKGSGYCMAITEKLEIPMETLKDIAFNSLKESAPDSKIDVAEYRKVNGKKILHLQMSGTMQGVKFVYYGYYYSNENGTTQLVCYTGTKLLDEYKADFEEFLNGMSVDNK
jgi:hypothetical protein